VAAAKCGVCDTNCVPCCLRFFRDRFAALPCGPNHRPARIAGRIGLTSIARIDCSILRHEIEPRRTGTRVAEQRNDRHEAARLLRRLREVQPVHTMVDISESIQGVKQLTGRRAQPGAGPSLGTWLVGTAVNEKAGRFCRNPYIAPCLESLRRMWAPQRTFFKSIFRKQHLLVLRQARAVSSVLAKIPVRPSTRFTPLFC